jgi:four helix bundle protein
MSQTTMASFAAWEKLAADGRTGDPLWSVQAYRLSVYALDCHTFDRRAHARLAKAPAFDQLTRAIASISANIAEGYSRGSRADRARFYGYALGSAREAIAWYDSLRIELGATVDMRQGVLIQVRRLLLTTLKKFRTESPDPSSREPRHFEP